MEKEKILNDGFFEYLRQIKNMTRGMLDKHNDIANDAVIHSYYLGQDDAINAVIRHYETYLKGKEDN